MLLVLYINIMQKNIAGVNDIIPLVGYDADDKELSRVKVALISAKGIVSVQ